MTELTQLLVAKVVINGLNPVVIWGMAAFAFRLSPRASTHWLYASLLGVLAQLSFVVRYWWSPDLVLVAPTVLAMAALALMRRGLQVFGRIPRTDRQHVAVTAGALIAASLVSATPVILGFNPMMLVIGALAAWVFARSAAEVRGFAQNELDTVGVRASVWPQWVLAGVCLAVGLVGAWDATLQTALSPASPLSTWLVMGSMLVSSFLILPLGFLVVMRLIAKLQRLSRHDPLTDLLNRRAMEDALQPNACVTCAAVTPIRCCCWTWTTSSASTTPTGMPRATPCW